MIGGCPFARPGQIESEAMSFREDLCEEKVSSLPLRDAIAVDPHTVVRAAIALMRSHGLGCAVVVDHHCRPIGVFTEQSVIDMLVEGKCLDTTPVSDCCDHRFFIVKTNDPIEKAWEAVTQHGARFLCVTDKTGQLIGLTGQRGLAEYVCDTFAQQVAVQRLGSTPWMLQREGA